MSLVEFVANQLLHEHHVPLLLAGGVVRLAQFGFNVQHALVALQRRVLDMQPVPDVPLHDQFVERQVHLPQLVRVLRGLVVHHVQDQRLTLQVVGHARVHEDVEVEIAIPLRRAGPDRTGLALVEVVEPEEDHGFNLVAGHERVADVPALQDVNGQLLLFEHVVDWLLHFQLFLHPVLSET